MSEQETSRNEQQPLLTQHAMLVLWGAFAQQIGLVKMLEQIDLRQKKREHRPQTKIIEFLLAILAGLPHLQDVSCAAHPLDQDQAVAEAWGQPGWADYSGVSRTLQSLNDDEANAIIDAVTAVSQPFIDQECERALASAGRLVYDADLTGRPVSNTSTSGRSATKPIFPPEPGSKASATTWRGPVERCTPRRIAGPSTPAPRCAAGGSPATSSS